MPIESECVCCIGCTLFSFAICAFYIQKCFNRIYHIYHVYRVYRVYQFYHLKNSISFIIKKSPFQLNRIHTKSWRNVI